MNFSDNHYFYAIQTYLYIQVISTGTRGQSCMNFQIGDSWVASSHPGVREPYLTTEYTLAAEASDKASAYLNFLIKNLGLCTSNSSNSKFRVCPCGNKYIFMKKLYINNTNHIKDVGNVYLSQHNINWKLHIFYIAMYFFSMKQRNAIT